MDSNQLKQLVESNTADDNAMVKEYLADKNMYDIVFPHGETLLHFSAGSNNSEMCEYLLDEKNMIVNLENMHGATPLYYASLKNAIDAVKVLIKYNADPRIRSGFSGWFPVRATSDLDIKNILTKHDAIVPVDYDNNYKIKQGFNLYQAYKYRLHRHWLSVVVNFFLKKCGIREIEGTMMTNEMKSIADTQGFAGLVSTYKDVNDDYIDSLTNCDDSCCLYCEGKSNLKRCTKCKQVLFCNKVCQKGAYLLHKFDCKDTN